MKKYLQTIARTRRKKAINSSLLRIIDGSFNIGNSRTKLMSRYFCINHGQVNSLHNCSL